MTTEEKKSSTMDILSELSLKDLEALASYIEQSVEYQKLYECTQMRDEAVRHPDGTANRGLHSNEVYQNAASLASAIIRGKNNNRELTEEDKKSIILAQIIGMAHDLGHTPMGHASEEVFSSLCSTEGKEFKFKHDMYSGVVFSNLLDRFLDVPANASEFRKQRAQRINESGIGEYVIEGVQSHGIYYNENLEGRMTTELPLMCGRLADTLSFMVSDLRDLSKVERAAGAKGKILTKEMLMELAHTGVITEIGNTEVDSIGDLPKQELQGKTLVASFKDCGFDKYEEIIDVLVSGDAKAIDKVRATIIEEITRYNVENDQIVSIPDDIKKLRDIVFNFRGKDEIPLEVSANEKQWKKI